MNLDRVFPRYTKFNPMVKVWCLTSEIDGCIHRFFDTCPISPSGRYAAFFRMPFENRPPRAGEAGQIVIVDMETGMHKIVDETHGWECQLGANINWGWNDNILLYSDVDINSWEVHCVRLNLKTGERKTFGNGIYHVSPDGTQILSTNPAAMRRTQHGYGVIVPDDFSPRNIGLREDDGLYLTNAKSGESKMLISIKEAVERTADPSILKDYDTFENYFFHAKWSPKGDRLLFTMRRFPIKHGKRFNTLFDDVVLFDVFTMKPDGTELFNAVPAEYWKRGGHHINWFPDGSKLSMNLGFKQDGIMRFTQAKIDGSEVKMMFENPIGSGHPSIHPNGKFLITDTYCFEPIAYGDGTTPIRLVNLEERTEKAVCRIQTKTPCQDEYVELRLDPHPVWDREFKKVIFNAFDGDTRRVYIADLENFI